MHFETFSLHLVASEDAHQSVFTKEFFYRLFAKIVGAFPLLVLSEYTLLRSFILHRIRPHQVTEESIQRNLLKPVNLVDVLQVVQMR